MGDRYTVILIGKDGERFPPRVWPAPLPSVIAVPVLPAVKCDFVGPEPKPVDIVQREFRRIGVDFDYSLQCYVQIYREI